MSQAPTFFHLQLASTKHRRLQQHLTTSILHAMAIVQDGRGRQQAPRRSAARSTPLSSEDLQRLMEEQSKVLDEQSKVYRNRDTQPPPPENFSPPLWNEERRCWISNSEIDPQKRKAYDGTTWANIEDASESIAERHNLLNGKLTQFLCFSSP
ncbi:hypothetical protein FGG08_000463 [Glutinoglossum americanum]|uniref:Uncharacterized protein n=1 Tax=Glutinoglossum americanum TaxID=1670608 RepID=A0A9P8IA75_9PEZI|nr:hypothetical protein FGG08_000463 [Glutinoglossum americanum]